MSNPYSCFVRDSSEIPTVAEVYVNYSTAVIPLKRRQLLFISKRYTSTQGKYKVNTGDKEHCI